MKRSLAAITTALLLTLAGCSNRVVLVADGTPVQLAEPVKAHVYITDAGGRRIKSGNRIVLPEGWWALPDDIEPRAGPFVP